MGIWGACSREARWASWVGVLGGRPGWAHLRTSALSVAARYRRDIGEI